MTETVQAFDVQIVLFSFPYCLGHDLHDLDFFFFFDYALSLSILVICLRGWLLMTVYLRIVQTLCKH